MICLNMAARGKCVGCKTCMSPETPKHLIVRDLVSRYAAEWSKQHPDEVVIPKKGRRHAKRYIPSESTYIERGTNYPGGKLQKPRD